MSNVFGDVVEVTSAATMTFTDHDIVGYQRGEALASALKAAFGTVGDLVVWKRP